MPIENSTQQWIKLLIKEPEGRNCYRKYRGNVPEEEIYKFINLCRDRALVITMEIALGPATLQGWGVTASLIAGEAPDSVREKAEKIRKGLLEHAEDLGFPKGYHLNLIQPLGTPTSMELHVLPEEIALLPNIEVVKVRGETLLELPKWATKKSHLTLELRAIC